VDNAQTKISLLHGSPNAPSVRVDAAGSNLVPNTAYGTFAGPLDVGRADVTLTLTDTGSNGLLNITAPLSLVSDTNVVDGPSSAILLFASGLFGQDTGASAFGIYGLTAYGNVFQLQTGPVGIEESLQSVELSAFPNPATENVSLTFDLPEAADISMRVLSINGKTVRSLEAQRFSSGPQTLQLERNGLPAGIYFLEISSPDLGRNTVKVMFQ
jgi:hypothetical protein